MKTKKVKVIIKIGGDKRKGRCWSKFVTGIDSTKKDGHMFIGEFLKEGEVLLEEGVVILQVETHGSWKNRQFLAFLGVVDSDGNINWQEDFNGINWQLKKVSIAEKCSELLLLNSAEGKITCYLKWSDIIPEELNNWIVESEEKEICVQCLLKSDLDKKIICQDNYLDYMLPVPIKTVIRVGYSVIKMLDDSLEEIYDTLIVVDVPYSDTLGLITDPEILKMAQEKGYL